MTTTTFRKGYKVTLYSDSLRPTALYANYINGPNLGLSKRIVWIRPLYIGIRQLLHGDLKEKIYMERPKGFVATGQEHLVCRLRKSLYGLKKAPRQWYKKFDCFIRSVGFSKSDEEHCLFTKQLKTVHPSSSSSTWTTCYSPVGIPESSPNSFGNCGWSLPWRTSVRQDTYFEWRLVGITLKDNISCNTGSFETGNMLHFRNCPLKNGIK